LMLMMNECDHQLFHIHVSEALQQQEVLNTEVNYKNSNLNDYIASFSETLLADLKTVDGELRSQRTDGWGTLVNTASSRLYLKQMNRTGETLLAKVAEPLETFAHTLGKH